MTKTLPTLIFSCFLVLSLSFYVKSQDCSSAENNEDYMGSLSVTISNNQCQMWSKHPSADSFEFIDSLEDASNFCRNPLGAYRKGRAYCFTNIEANEWEYCNITKCLGCSKIHGISYGTIQFSNRVLLRDGSYQSGSKIIFSCRPNLAVYDPTSGPLEIVCNNNGLWSSNRLPRCLWRGFIDSASPNCWYNSEKLLYNSTPRRLFYDTKSNAEGTQCINWSNYNGYTNKDFPQEGKVNAKNFCRSPGDFEPQCPVSSDTLKSCKIPQCAGCGAIPYIKYTSYDINYLPNVLENTMDTGSFVNYRCSAGNLVGNSKITCIKGKWDGELPYCDIKFCSQPPPKPKNTDLSYRRIVYANIEDYGKEHLMFDETTYKFTCKPTYQFNDSTVTELAYECKSGEWTLVGKGSNCVPQSGVIPMPEALCQLPKEIPNGYKSGGELYKVGMLNEYYGYFLVECQRGYKLVGSANVSCVEGKWSSYPKCVIQSGCSFDILYKPAENVKILTSSLYYTPDNSAIAVGSYVNYECLPNYLPEISADDLKVKCLDDGRWSTSIPVKCVMQNMK